MFDKGLKIYPEDAIAYINKVFYIRFNLKGTSLR